MLRQRVDAFLDRAVPVVPLARLQFLDAGRMTSELDRVDGVTRRVQTLAQESHVEGGTGKPVDQQAADVPPTPQERFG